MHITGPILSGIDNELLIIIFQPIIWANVDVLTY